MGGNGGDYIDNEANRKMFKNLKLQNKFNSSIKVKNMGQGEQNPIQAHSMNTIEIRLDNNITNFLPSIRQIRNPMMLN